MPTSDFQSTDLNRIILTEIFESVRDGDHFSSEVLVEINY